MFDRAEYYHNHPVVSKELAQLFIERHVKMICLDTPSPDRDPFDIHKLLLENNVLIAENCTNFDRLTNKNQFEVIALPLRIHTDSSPARIIARVKE
jgi:kynurenine formamidase